MVYTVGFLAAGLLALVLGWRLLARLGRRLSYGAYLGHYPLLALAGTLGLPARAALVTAATIAAAWLTYVLVDLPLAVPRRSAVDVNHEQISPVGHRH